MLDMSIAQNVVTGLLCFSIPITLIGNVMVILVICKLKRTLRVTTHYILLNIAIVDFLSGFLAQPIMLLNLTFWDEDFHGKYEFLCGGLGVISATIAYVSFLTVAGIAVDRCLVVRLKHRYKTVVTPHRMVTLILIIWSIAIAMVYPVPRIICPSFHFSYQQVRRMCVAADNVNIDYSGGISPSYHLGDVPAAADEGCKKTVAYMEAFALIILPVFVVVVSSATLVFSLKRRACQSGAIRRSVETVIIMTSGFSICVLPYSATVGISPAVIGPGGMVILIFFMHLHSSINPVIYLTRSSKFRDKAWTMGSRVVGSFKRHMPHNSKKVGEGDMETWSR